MTTTLDSKRFGKWKCFTKTSRLFNKAIHFSIAIFVKLTQNATLNLSENLQFTTTLGSRVPWNRRFFQEQHFSTNPWRLRKRKVYSLSQFYCFWKRQNAIFSSVFYPTLAKTHWIWPKHHKHFSKCSVDYNTWHPMFLQDTFFPKKFLSFSKNKKKSF